MTPDDRFTATALTTLSAALGDPRLDLQRGLDRFAAAARAAVPSFSGLSMTLSADGIPVTIAAPDGDAGEVAMTSLVIPLSALHLSADGELVLFATAAGAFVDLAADLAYATATEMVTFAIDSRLGSREALTVGVAGFSKIHQAIGMLIDRGSTPEQARARIAESAVQDGHDLVEAAQRILDGKKR